MKFRKKDYASADDMTRIHALSVRIKDLLEGDGILVDQTTLAALSVIQASAFYQFAGGESPKTRRRMKAALDNNFDVFLEHLVKCYGPMARDLKDIKGKPNPKSKWKPIV